MDDKILITFASRYGSTKQVAEKIAAVLQERNYSVDVIPVNKVKSLSGYSFIILGAALYIGNMLKPARHFLTRFRAELVNHKVALIALGPTHLHDDEMTANDQQQLDAILAKTPWFTPVSKIVFGGKYDPARLKFFDKLIATLPASPLHNLPASDARDWTAITRWAQSLEI